jgi:hypothetical protein
MGVSLPCQRDPNMKLLHSCRIMVNLTDSLARQLKGCRVIPANVPLKTSHKLFRYADLSVACNPESDVELI